MYIERLFEKYSDLKVLKFFLTNPDKEIHVKGLAREIGVSPGTASKVLNRAAEEGILRKKEVANVHLYSYNDKSGKARKLKEVLEA